MNAELVAHIKPGEFAFCSRCGGVCKHTDKAFMCVACRSSLFSRTGKLSELEIEERLLEKRTGIEVNDICREYRRDLAELRKEHSPAATGA